MLAPPGGLPFLPAEVCRNSGHLRTSADICLIWGVCQIGSIKTFSRVVAARCTSGPVFTVTYVSAARCELKLTDQNGNIDIVK